MGRKTGVDYNRRQLRKCKMAIIVIGKITISRGFETWKNMVFASEAQMKAIGMSMLVAGTAKADPTSLNLVMTFETMEGLEKFRTDEALTARRVEAGAVLETAVMTMLSDDYFTNFPAA